MSHGPASRAAWSAAGLLACTLGSAGALALLGGRFLAALPRDQTSAAAAGIDQWVEMLVLTVGILAAGWVLAGATTALACVAVVRLTRSTRTLEAVLGGWAPGIVRRLARGAAGVGLGAGLALAPVAASADVAPGPSDDATTVLDLGWQSTNEVPAEHDDGASTGSGSGSGSGKTSQEPALPDGERGDGEDDAGPPDPPTDSQDDVDDARPTALRLAPGDAPDGTPVVVVQGDTLWDIAARSLPAEAADADILRAATRWHEANRDVVGDDPDIILPGQELYAP